jgi:hypothetical protein
VAVIGRAAVGWTIGLGVLVALSVAEGPVLSVAEGLPVGVSVRSSATVGVRVLVGVLVRVGVGEYALPVGVFVGVSEGICGGSSSVGEGVTVGLAVAVGVTSIIAVALMTLWR